MSRDDAFLISTDNLFNKVRTAKLTQNYHVTSAEIQVPSTVTDWMT